MGFVKNLILFLTVQKFDKIITDYVMYCFYRPRCVLPAAENWVLWKCENSFVKTLIVTMTG